MNHLLSLTFVVTACAPQYSYVPTTNATATIQGKVAADYPVPTTASQGDLRIASYGMTDVSPDNAPNEVLRALHLRVVLADNATTPWTFDTRDQRVSLADGHDVIAPSVASTNAGDAPPLVTVPPNGKRVVDLFFLLPADLQHADEIPEFDAMWRVTTSAGVTANRTPFERLTIDPDVDDSNADWNYGDDYYWGGPYWIRGDFPYAQGPGGVRIHRSPHIAHGARGGFHGAHGGGFHGGGGGHGGGGHR